MNNDKVWLKHVEEHIFVSDEDTTDRVKNLFGHALDQLGEQGLSWNSLSVSSQCQPNAGGVFVSFTGYAVTPR